MPTPTLRNRRPSAGLTRDSRAWGRHWLQAKARSPVNVRERRGRREELHHWNRRAQSYAQHAQSEASRARKDWVLDWLDAVGALSPGGRVLDIGAGPGGYALPLAARAAEVVALEPAEGMCAILAERIRRGGVGNIQVVQSTWEEADLSTRGWQKTFDLVFASMSPGVSSPETLEKMLAASRGWCYLSGWSGSRWGRWGLAQEELWPGIFGEALGDYPSDVLYPFGLLYALGYRPTLRFERPEVHLEMAAADAVAGLVEHFDRYVAVDTNVRRIIEDYVTRSSSGADGLFRQDFLTCQGFMIWRV